ncbi:MAG: KEOPS complex subunit Pcc1 [Candidatus Anstonellales archaeon]
MKSRALLALTVKDPYAFIKAVEHERHSKRVRTSISYEGNVVKIEVEAEDATSLRATLNTYLRIAQSAEELEGG